jgi:hypothetical protein
MIAPEMSAAVAVKPITRDHDYKGDAVTET